MSIEKKGEFRIPNPEQALINAEVLLLENAIETKNEERIAELGQIHEVVWATYKKCEAKGNQRVVEELRRRFGEVLDRR